jgi:hypothetical protein
VGESAEKERRENIAAKWGRKREKEVRKEGGSRRRGNCIAGTGQSL